MKQYVIKRDGRQKELDLERVEKAICKAYIEVYGNDEKFKDDSVVLMPLIRNRLVGIDNITVEEIQDIIVHYLKDVDNNVWKAYREYREERTITREYNTDIYKKLGKVLNATEIVNSNANVDEASFGGRKFETAGLIMKKYALDNLIDKDIADAHRNNRGYIHDLDCLALGMTNCSFPDMRHLLLDGFSTRNGDVRGANSISTAMQQVAVIFQVQSQDQYGLNL